MKSNSKLAWASVACALTGAVGAVGVPSAFAQSATAQFSVTPAASSTPVLRETVVSVTRSPQNLSDVVADVSIIDRSMIERSGAGGLADVLARVPGMEMARNGGPGATTSLFVRGAENRFTAVYLDGVRIDSQATGGVSWESIPLALIDRIEVLRGPAAAVYGSDALGGVVSIFTQKGDGATPFAPTVGIGLGNRGTRRLSAGLSGGQGGGAGAFDYAIGLVGERSNGFNSRTTVTQNPDSDGYTSQAANANLGFQINAAHRLDATLLANNVNSQYDSSGSNASNWVDERSRYKLQTMGLVWRAKWLDPARGSENLAYTTRLSLTDSTSRYETSPSPYLTQTHLTGVLLQNEFRWGAQQFNVNLEHKGDALDNAASAFSPGINKGRYQDGVALGWGTISGAHTVQLNVRHDRDSEFGGKATGSAAYAYSISNTLRATASVGNAFRAPTLYQRFSEYGVASLKPESSRNAEVSLRYSEGSTQLGAVAYQSRVTNLISFAGAGPCISPYGCYANTARAAYEGITLSGQHRVSGVPALGNVDLRGSWDVQNPRDLDTGKRLARRAKQHAQFGADARIANWLVGAELQIIDQRFSSPGEVQSLGGYSLFNLNASTRIAKEWTLLARADNLFNRKYESVSGYATPGLTLYVGLKWAPL